MKRDALPRLIAPLGVDEFVTSYWMQRSLHVVGSSDKVGALFSLDAFHAAVAAAVRRPDAAAHGFSVRAGPIRPIAPAAIGDELAAGQTICVSAIELGDPRLADVAAELKWQLAFPGRVAVNAYLSPRGSGFSFVHFDARIATTLQISGRKRWRYAERSSLPWPEHNVRIAPDGRLEWHQPPNAREQQADLPGPLALELAEVVLEPGHLLCLPAGTFHAAEAVDDLSLSININFNFNSPRMFELLRPQLEQALTAADIGELLRARLGDLRWHQARCSPDPRAPRPLARPLEPTDRLDVVTASLFVPATGDTSYLVTARGPVEIAGAALLPFARELVEHRSFVAGDALAWSGTATPYRWDALKPVLVALIDRGVLVP